jgi:glycosyltransferase involved in cell wall biosynthesis
MRVLVLSNFYPPNAMGGYELSCRDVVDRWRAEGHEVVVLTTAETVDGTVEPAGDEPHVRRELRWWWHEHRFLRPPWRERLAVEKHDLRVLRGLLAAFRPDVVSVWHMGGMPLSLLDAVAEQRVVLNICDEWPAYGPRVDPWLSGLARLPRAVRRLVARATGVPTTLPDLDRHQAAVVSSATLEVLRRTTTFTFPRAVVVGSGIDTHDFPLVTPVDRRWEWRLLAVGRVEPRKGFDTAVAALDRLPDLATLRIAGVADPEHLAALTHPRVQLGAVPRSEVAGLYRDADVLVFPSRWQEPFGLVPLEAMSQGVPVVATRQGGSAEFLEDEVNCLVVPPDDPQALAAAVTRLADDPALRRRLTAAGLDTAGQWTLAGLAERLALVHGL